MEYGIWNTKEVVPILEMYGLQQIQATATNCKLWAQLGQFHSSEGYRCYLLIYLDPR